MLWQLSVQRAIIKRKKNCKWENVSEMRMKQVKYTCHEVIPEDEALSKWEKCYFKVRISAIVINDSLIFS